MIISNDPQAVGFILFGLFGLFTPLIIWMIDVIQRTLESNKAFATLMLKSYWRLAYVPYYIFKNIGTIINKDKKILSLFFTALGLIVIQSIPFAFLFINMIGFTSSAIIIELVLLILFVLLIISTVIIYSRLKLKFK